MNKGLYLDYLPLVTILRERGWEVTAYDEVLARRDGMPGVWTVAIDHGGRLRFTSVRPASVPQGHRVQRSYRRYRLLHEEQSTLTVTTKLAAADDLAPVLDQLAAFVAGRDL